MQKGVSMEESEKMLKPIENLTDKEIIELCMDKEKSVATCFLQLARYTNKTQKDSEEGRKNVANYETIKDRMIYNPIIDIQPRPSIVSIRLKFKSAVDPELKLMWSILNDYGEKISLLNDKENDCFLSMSFMPNDYAGQVMVTAVNPLSWTLEPEIVGMPINNILHIDFWATNMFIVDGDDLGNANIQEEIANINREGEKTYRTREGEIIDD